MQNQRWRSALAWMTLVVGALCSSCQLAPVAQEAPPCTANIPLRLADSPGPHGHPLASSPWKIAVGEKPEGLAYVDEEMLLAQGETDSMGRIALLKHESDRISALACEGLTPVWFVYPGYTGQISGVRRSKYLSDNEDLLHRLMLEGYFYELPVYSASLFNSPSVTEVLYMARQDYGVESNEALLKKLRELQP